MARHRGLDFVLIPFLFGLGTAVVTMVGMNIGAGQPARARRIAWTGAAIAAIACETVGLSAALFPDVWNGLFTRDPAVLNEGAIYLHRVAPAYGFVGLGMLLYFAAQGTGRMLVPFIAGLSRLGVAAGVGWYCVARLGAGTPTLFLAVSAAAVTFGIVNALGTLVHTRESPSNARPIVRLRRVWTIAAGAVAVAALVAVAGLILGRARTSEPHIASRAPVVRTVVVSASRETSMRFTGVIHARYESALGFRVSGKIMERMVDPGDRVRKGQALMRLDPTDFDLSLKARAGSGGIGARDIGPGRIGRASPTQACRPGMGDDAGLRTEQGVRGCHGRAQLRSALAQEKQADDQARYAVLEADADGVIMEAPGEPGQVVTAGQTVVRLAHEGAREAEIYLPEGTVRQAGDTATASLYADPNQSIPARLRELSSMADPSTRTYRARYVLDGPGKDAPLGATVTVHLPETSASRSVYDIPIGAIGDNGNGPFIWQVDEDTSTVSPRSIEIIRMGEENAVVSGSIEKGERIVALGAQLLRSGEKVEIGTSSLDTAAR